MITTYQALGVALLAILPGALYTFAIEGRTGLTASLGADRFLKILVRSALLQAIAAPALYQLYRVVVVPDLLGRGVPLPGWAWVVVGGYVAVPYLVGRAAGWAQGRGPNWLQRLVGTRAAPQAWDHFFTGSIPVNGYLRLRLLDPGAYTTTNQAGDPVEGGRWVVGEVAEPQPGMIKSYAAGYPQPQDLYLQDTIECDPVTGEMFTHPGTDDLVFRGIGLLIRWDQVAYFEYLPGDNGTT